MATAPAPPEAPGPPPDTTGRRDPATRAAKAPRLYSGALADSGRPTAGSPSSGPGPAHAERPPAPSGREDRPIRPAGPTGRDPEALAPGCAAVDRKSVV